MCPVCVGPLASRLLVGYVYKSYRLDLWRLYIRLYIYIYTMTRLFALEKGQVDTSRLYAHVCLNSALTHHCED